MHTSLNKFWDFNKMTLKKYYSTHMRLIPTKVNKKKHKWVARLDGMRHTINKISLKVGFSIS